jgi:hypothetical protein
MKVKINGFISIDEYGCLCVGNSYIIEKINEEFSTGDKVSVRYYITDTETSEEEAMEANIMRSIGASIDSLDFILEAYSEYTILEYNEKLKIGGHDLFAELCSYEGKYLNLTIGVNENE